MDSNGHHAKRPKIIRDIAAEPVFLQPFTGDLLEWLKRHAWKVCIPLKGIKGSNPLVSAF